MPMTLARLLEQRTTQIAEQRSSAMTSWPNGWG